MNKQKQEEYRAYVEEKTPKNNVYANMLKAFVTGGTICLIGQFILNKVAPLNWKFPTDKL